MTPAKRVTGRSRSCIREDRQDEALGVPERVAIVAGAGQSLGGDRALLGAGAGLQRVEEREPNGLLQLEVALQLDVGRFPELVQVGALPAQQAVPARVTGSSECSDDLVAESWLRAPARPPVSDELDHPEHRPFGEFGGHREAADVRPAFHRRLGAVRTLDDVVHARRHAEIAAPCGVHQHGTRVAVEEALRDERRFQRGGRAGISRSWRPRLVGHELRLDDDADGLTERLDLVQDRRSRAVDERDEPSRSNPHGSAGR